MPACRFGLWAMSDLESYGPALSTWVARHEIRRRCDGAEVRVFAPFGHLHPVRADGGEPAEPLGRWSPARASELAGLADCVVITGEVVVDEDRLAAMYGSSPGEVRTCGLSRFFVEGLGPELEEDCPVVWQSVGLDDDDEADISARLRAALAGRSLVTVRDERSRRRLEKAGVEHGVTVLPDPILLLPRVLPQSLLSKRLAYVRLMGWYPTAGPAMVVEASEQLRPSVAALAGEAGDAAVVVVELTPYGRSDEFADALAGALGRDVFRMPAVAAGEDIAAALGAAEAGFIGTSTYGATTARAYGRPAVVLDSADMGQGSVADAYRAALAVAGDASALAALTNALDRHFDRMIEIGADAAGRMPRRVPGSTAQVDAMRQTLDARAERTAAERATFADRVVDLEADIARLEVEAGHLQRWGKEQAEARATAEQELVALQATRTFRWTGAARDLYRRLRARTGTP